MAGKNHGEPVKLIALDMDGTLLNNASVVSKGNQEALRYAFAHGAEVVISTGRPISAISVETFRSMNIRYAITTNGAAVFDLFENRCIEEYGLPKDVAMEILERARGLKLHLTAHIDNVGYCPIETRDYVPDLLIPESMKQIYMETRKFIPDFWEFVKNNPAPVQKITLNFLRENGVLLHREEMESYLMGRDDVSCVCGGSLNLETTNLGVDKGNALVKLGEKLGIDVAQIMAMGDSGNDMSMLKAAGIAVSMGNGAEEVKAVADYVSVSNEEDGVAKAIYHYLK